MPAQTPKSWLTSAGWGLAILSVHQSIQLSGPLPRPGVVRKPEAFRAAPVRWPVGAVDVRFSRGVHAHCPAVRCPRRPQGPAAVDRLGRGLLEPCDHAVGLRGQLSRPAGGACFGRHRRSGLWHHRAEPVGRLFPRRQARARDGHLLLRHPRGLRLRLRRGRPDGRAFRLAGGFFRCRHARPGACRCCAGG